MKALGILYVIILQMIIPFSTLYADWPEGGLPVCTVVGIQSSPVELADMNGGFFVSWRDFRGYPPTGVYIQRVDGHGNKLWNFDGVLLSTASVDHSVTDMISDGVGGVILVWFLGDINDYDINAQRFDSSGNKMWGIEGITIVSEVNNQIDPVIISDGGNGYIVAWNDERDGDMDIFAQRIDSDGNVLWPVNGVCVCNDPGWQGDVQLVANGSNGALVVWKADEGYNQGIFANCLSSAGDTLWPGGRTVVCDSTAGNTIPSVLPFKGGVVVAWDDNRGGDYDTYIQRIDSDGQTLWSLGGNGVCVEPGDSKEVSIAMPDSSGIIAVWSDYRNGDYDIYVQKVDTSGSILWSSGGIVIKTAEGDQWSPSIVSRSDGGAVISWCDESGSDPDILAQRIDSDGNILWDVAGKSVSTTVGIQQNPVMISSADDCSVITWEDARGTDLDIYSMKLDENGFPLAAVLCSSSACRVEEGVSVNWELSECNQNTRFIVLRRAEGEGSFRELDNSEVIRRGLMFSYMDRECDPGAIFQYRVDIIEENTREILFVTEPVSLGRVPVLLYQNYPNPFNPSTQIGYSVDERTHVSLTIYDIKGRRIVCLVDEEKKAGLYSVIWNGFNERSEMVSSGVYFYRIKAGKKILTKRMVLLR
ncbi:T9SS type A sorting domain-containing protein [bacterium]|nr:T9SS type A sorting domain-containing protein [bacterium]